LYPPRLIEEDDQTMNHDNNGEKLTQMSKASIYGSAERYDCTE
jgi:hypothetical protein